MGKRRWKRSADRLAQHRVATDPQFCKKRTKNAKCRHFLLDSTFYKSYNDIRQLNLIQNVAKPFFRRRHQEIALIKSRNI